MAKCEEEEEGEWGKLTYLHSRHVSSVWPGAHATNRKLPIAFNHRRTLLV